MKYVECPIIGNTLIEINFIFIRLQGRIYVGNRCLAKSFGYRLGNIIVKIENQLVEDDIFEDRSKSVSIGYKCFIIQICHLLNYYVTDAIQY